MKRISMYVGIAGLLAGILFGCSNEELPSSDDDTSVQSDLIDVAQTSGQLASGTSFRISGSSSDSVTTQEHKPGGKHRHGPALLDGVNLLAPTDELVAIIDAESASDFRGMRISKNGGATITNYNSAGEVVTLDASQSGGPGGCSFSGNQFPTYDSLLATITKTIIDFGSGATYKRDTITITRTGKIIITRNGTRGSMTEVATFEKYTVNGIGIAGTKTRVSTFDSTSGSGKSTTSVSDGKITLKDGTVATWTSDKTRTSDIVLDESSRPVSGQIVSEVNSSLTKSDGVLLYSHVTTKPLVENIACDRRRHGPVSGTLQTVYGSDTVIVDYGDGTCENTTVTITINGVTSTKTIGE